MSNQDNALKAERLKRFEERQSNRQERYEELADKATSKSTAYFQRSSEMADCIPFGQPILVGHHSEKRDRNFRAKIHSTMGKSVEEMKKAEYYENKAASVGTGGISSDDPNAPDKLQAKLEGLQKAQERMKAANKLIRKVTDREECLKGLIELGLSEKVALEALTPLYGRCGFPAYALQNNNAEIKRLKSRIAELNAIEERPTQEVETDLYKYSECKIENRCMFIFEGKPSDEIRQILKGNGFKWSPSRGAWVRQLNANGIGASKRVMNQLNAM
ncbi:DUF3560 domain-containing protein (plasmid) [Acinetobacter baumannii]